MGTDTEARGSFRRVLALRGEDWLALGMLAVLFMFALAGAFDHMHGWTIDSINEALRENAEARGVTPVPVTPDWFGWSNAVTSEIMPTYALLTVRKRQRQGRSITGPAVLFVGSSVLSLLAQLSATGVRVPYDAQLLVCLPAVALMILGAFKFADMSYGRQAAVTAELERERRTELAARKAADAAHLAAELEHREAHQAAELAARREREAAELAARLDRERREHEAHLEHERLRIEGESITRREQIAAAERAEVRAAEERQRQRRSDIERAAAVERARIAAEAEAERVRADAARIEADAARVAADAERAQVDAEARRAAAERVAAARHEARGTGGQGAADPGGSDDAATDARRRRPRHETAALVGDVLATLPAGTERAAAVAEVAAALNVTAKYAREFIPEGWVAGGPAEESGSSSAAGSAPASLPDGTSSAVRLRLVPASSA